MFCDLLSWPVSSTSPSSSSYFVCLYMRPFPAGAWLRTPSSAAVFSDNKMTQRACGGVEGRSIVSSSPQAHVFTLGPSQLMSQSRTPGIKNNGRINISHNVGVAGKGGGSHCVYWVIWRFEHVQWNSLKSCSLSSSISHSSDHLWLLGVTQERRDAHEQIWVF